MLKPLYAVPKVRCPFDPAVSLRIGLVPYS